MANLKASLMAVCMAGAAIGGASAFVSSTFGVTKSSASQLGAILEGRKIEGELKPTNNFVLVKLAPIEESTSGGIFLTGSSKIVKTEGTVVSVGPGKTHTESGITFDMPVSPGDGVVYGKYDGTVLEYNDERHTLIRDDDIMVKFTGTLTIDSVEVTGENVLISVKSSDEEESPSGLLIAAQTKRGTKPSTGEIVKVGPGKMASNGELMGMDVKIGDMVKFRDFAGNDVEIDGKDFAVVRYTDLLAKF